MRLDQYLVEQKLAKSRTFAAELIAAGKVLVNNAIITKAAFPIKATDKISINELTHDYVSRAALKLEAAFQTFAFDLKNKVVLDIGSSTGGFSEFCLRQGCAIVYAVDVGTQQMAEKIRKDKRIRLFENTDIRDFKPERSVKFDYIFCDVSFISLTLILAKIAELSQPTTKIVTLFKPQFEVGAKYLNKQGLVKDKSAVVRQLWHFIESLPQFNLGLLAAFASPLSGKNGNIEYLLYLKRRNNSAET